MMANSVSAARRAAADGRARNSSVGLARAEARLHPDRLVFDFDPDEALGWDSIGRCGRPYCASCSTRSGSRSFLKTTGGKGLHVVVPIEPTRDWDEAKAFCKAIAELLVRTFPDRFTSKLQQVDARGPHLRRLPAQCRERDRDRRLFGAREGARAGRDADRLGAAEGGSALRSFQREERAGPPAPSPAGSLGGADRSAAGADRRDAAADRRRLTPRLQARAVTRRTTMARPIWKGMISFGLVSVPVALYPAEQSHQLSFSMLDKRDFSPVGYKRYNKKTGQGSAVERHRQGLRVREGPVRRAERRGFPPRQRAAGANRSTSRRSSTPTAFRRNTSRRPIISFPMSADRRSMRCCARRCARPARSASGKSSFARRTIWRPWCRSTKR